MHRFTDFTPPRPVHLKSPQNGQKKGLWDLQLPKPGCTNDFREEVVTGGSATEKLFVQ